MVVDVSQILSHIASGVVGGLAVAVASHFLTKDRDNKRDEAAGILAERLILIPLIDGLIHATTNCGPLLGKAHDMVRPKLQDSAMRFRVLLKNRNTRLTLFNSAWDTLAGTAREEAENKQPNTSDLEYQRQKQVFLSRLEAFRKVIHDA